MCSSSISEESQGNICVTQLYFYQLEREFLYFCLIKLLCSLQLQQESFPRGTSVSQLQILYKKERSSRYINIGSPSQTQYTLRNLGFEEKYNISIRTVMQFSYCYSYIYGEYSDEVTAVTMETGKLDL